LKDWRFIVRKNYRRVWPEKRPEPEVWKAIRKIRGLSFIDVGANKGQVYTFRLYRNFFRTYAIEPHPQLAEELREKVAKMGMEKPHQNTWGIVEVHEWAASDSNRDAELTVGIGLGSSTLELRNHATKSVKVETRRLDDWWGEGQISLLKIDVEGSEFRALKGASRILALTKNLIVELHEPSREGELWSLLYPRFPALRWLDNTHLWAGR
jgi:FkbM family methyltransferase